MSPYLPRKAAFKSPVLGASSRRSRACGARNSLVVRKPADGRRDLRGPNHHRRSRRQLVDLARHLYGDRRRFGQIYVATPPDSRTPPDLGRSEICGSPRGPPYWWIEPTVWYPNRKSAEGDSVRTSRQCGHARRRLPIQIVTLSVTTIPPLFPPLPTLFVDLPARALPPCARSRQQSVIYMCCQYNIPRAQERYPIQFPEVARSHPCRTQISPVLKSPFEIISVIFLFRRAGAVLSASSDCARPRLFAILSECDRFKQVGTVTIKVPMSPGVSSIA